MSVVERTEKHLPRRWLHRLALGIFVALYALQLTLILTADGFAPWALVLLPLALYLADLLSGVAHFLLDYRRTAAGAGLRELYCYAGDKGSDAYVAQRLVVMRRISALDRLAYDFKVHHLSTGALGRRSFLLLVAPALYFIGFPLLLLGLALQLAGGLEMLPALLLWGVTGALVLAQYTHSCAHRPVLPAWVRVLQKAGIFMTAVQHRAHHRNLGVDFCIINGWANPLVNRIFSFSRRRGWIFEQGLEPL